MMTLRLPYNTPPLTPDQQAGQNISAMMQLKAQGAAPSIADQVKRHINLVHLVEAALMPHTSY